VSSLSWRLPPSRFKLTSQLCPKITGNSRPKALFLFDLRGIVLVLKTLSDNIAQTYPRSTIATPPRTYRSGFFLRPRIIFHVTASFAAAGGLRKKVPSKLAGVPDPWGPKEPTPASLMRVHEHQAANTVLRKTRKKSKWLLSQYVWD
jgi:hypothetical protein